MRRLKAKEYHEKEYDNLDEMNQEINQDYINAGYQEATQILNLYHQISELYTTLEMDYDIEENEMYSKEIVDNFNNAIKSFDRFGFLLQKKLDELSNTKVTK